MYCAVQSVLNMKFEWRLKYRCVRTFHRDAPKLTSLQTNMNKRTFKN